MSSIVKPIFCEDCFEGTILEPSSSKKLLNKVRWFCNSSAIFMKKSLEKLLKIKITSLIELDGLKSLENIDKKKNQIVKWGDKRVSIKKLLFTGNLSSCIAVGIRAIKDKKVDAKVINIALSHIRNNEEVFLVQDSIKEILKSKISHLDIFLVGWNEKKFSIEMYEKIKKIIENFSKKISINLFDESKKAYNHRFSRQLIKNKNKL